MTASSWAQLAEQLADRLLRLGDGDVINLVSAGRYTQLIQRDVGLTLEAVSNRFLPPKAQLTTGQEQQLEEKGWQQPIPPRRNNWWLDVDQWPLHSRDAARIADLMVSTLRDVYGVADPDAIDGRAFNADRTV